MIASCPASGQRDDGGAHAVMTRRERRVVHRGVGLADRGADALLRRRADSPPTTTRARPRPRAGWRHRRPRAHPCRRRRRRTARGPTRRRARSGRTRRRSLRCPSAPAPSRSAMPTTTCRAPRGPRGPRSRWRRRRAQCRRSRRGPGIHPPSTLHHVARRTSEASWTAPRRAGSRRRPRNGNRRPRSRRGRSDVARHDPVSSSPSD